MRRRTDDAWAPRSLQRRATGSMRVPGTLPPCFPTTATRGLQGFARGWRHVLHCGPKLLETEFAPSVAEAGDSLHAKTHRRCMGSTFVTAAALSQPSACPASVEENTTLADGLRVQSPTFLPSRTTCSWAPRLLQPVASCCWSTGILYCWSMGFPRRLVGTPVEARITPCR